MTLHVEIAHRFGPFEVDVAFDTAGGLTALFGPSGSGKTTVINAIAGLLTPDRGRVMADGRTLLDTGSGLALPMHLRRIGYVFQEARLFPHMTVSQNLRYGRFFTPARERYVDMATVVDLLGIGHLLDRRPQGLSGGERQRVAIGRALIASPRLILMDEPLAALDDQRKAEILPYIERLRDEMRIPIVYVSHSLAEIARLASNVVLLEDGRVRAAGAVADILPRHDLLPPGERGEAGALVQLELVGHEEAFGLSVLRSSAGEWRLPQIAVPAGARVSVRVRARDVMVAVERPAGISALNVLEGRVDAIEPAGASDVTVTILSGSDRISARITRRSAGLLGLKPGLPVFAVVKSVSLEGSFPERR